MKERVAFFDTYRFIAAMMIFLTHFISSFSKVSFRYFHMMPYSIFLEAVRGALGVSMLCVILGYFAYKKGESSSESLVALSLKRYLYFVVIAIVYYIIAFGTGLSYIGGGFLHASKALAVAAILLTDEYNGLFWTLIPMLIGSMICYVLGRSRMQTSGILVISLALLIMRDAQVVNCVLGCFVAAWQDSKFVKKCMSHRYVQLITLIITFCTIRAEHESFHLYVLQGVFCVALLVVTLNNDRLAKIMGASLWTKFNRSYFSIYVFHSLLYHKLGKKLMYMDGSVPYKLRFVLVFLLITTIVVVLSKPLDKVVGFLTKHIYRVVEITERRFNRYLSNVEAS